jgi:rhomboid protease GluP
MTDPAEGAAAFGAADDDDGPRNPLRQPALLAIAVACLLPELILSGADLGLWGSTRWRGTALQYAGFWSGLLGNWQPNYPFQSLAMFATYGFLHAGFSHFLVNMITLFSLGDPVIARIGTARFLWLYLICLIGGAVGFALFSSEIAPMVGASGALFGLAGALLAWEFTARRRNRQRLTPVYRSLLMLAALNLILWWAMKGHLAWETHLGGFLAGWVFALLVHRRNSAQSTG